MSRILLPLDEYFKPQTLLDGTFLASHTVFCQIHVGTLSIPLLGRFGTLTEYSLTMSADSFRQYSWGQYKGSRVFTQLKDFGVNGRYEQDDTTLETEIFLSLGNEEATPAPQVYVKALIKKHGEDDGLELFKRGDMRIWSR